MAEQHEIAYDCHTFNRDRQWFDRFQLKITSVSSHTSLSAKTTLKYTPQSPSMWENELFHWFAMLGFSAYAHCFLMFLHGQLLIWPCHFGALECPFCDCLFLRCWILRVMCYFCLCFFPGRIFVMCFAAVYCSLSQETSAMCHEDPQSPQAGSLMQQNCGKCSASNRKPGWDLLVTSQQMQGVLLSKHIKTLRTICSESWPAGTAKITFLAHAQGTSHKFAILEAHPLPAQHTIVAFCCQLKS